jgi:uncharacterized membrane protein
MGVITMRGKIKLSVLFVGLLAVIAFSSAVSALPSVDYVKINGDEYVNGDTLVVEKGDSLDIKVKLQASNQSYKDLEVEADIIGYEYNDKDAISDSTHTFDMDAGDTVYQTLSVSIPVKAEKDYYDLRIRLSGRTGSSQEVLLRLNLKGERHSLEIKSVLLHPSNSIEAGSYLLVNAKVINRGEKTENDIRVTASIPKLGLEDSYYLDELDADESKTSEELFLRIPACTKPGKYDVEVELDYDEEYESIKSTSSINILESEGLCGASDAGQDVKSIISVGAQAQQVVRGTGGATYSIAITNPAKTDKTYTLAVSGLDSWGSFRVDPATTVLVKAGQTKPIFVFVSANDDAQGGQKSFTITLSSGQESEAIQFYANITKGAASGIKSWIEFVLIALVVLLIILGLIIGITRAKGRESGKESEEDLTGQTYY